MGCIGGCYAEGVYFVVVLGFGMGLEGGFEGVSFLHLIIKVENFSILR